MFRTNVVEGIKKHVLFPVIFFSKIVPFYEIMWKNNVDAGRAHKTIWRMRIACWITKTTDTDTHSQYVIFIAFPLQ